MSVMMRVNDRLTMISNYLNAYNPVFNLSDTEIKVLSVLINEYLNIKNNGVNNDKFINEILFSKKYKDKVREHERVNMNYANYSNFISRAVKRDIFVRDEDDNSLKLNNKFINKFKIHKDKKGRDVVVVSYIITMDNVEKKPVSE